MSPPDRSRSSLKVSLPIRIGAGVVGALIAGTLATLFIGDMITSAVAAIFFGFGVAITIGSVGSDGAGGDGGGGG